MSYSKHKTEFVVKIDSTEWNSERSLPVSQSAGQVGTEATFDVSYEPTSLGTKSTIMTISSPSGGDYTFPLVGKCLAPNPQGPFTIRAKASQMIPFKNIFNKPAEFHLVIDNPHFTIPKDVELIKPKKTHYFSVNYTGTFTPFNVTMSLPISIRTCNFQVTVPNLLALILVSSQYQSQENFLVSAGCST